MISFVQPSARAKFGIAAASSIALIGASTVPLPANAATFAVTNCDLSGAGSLASAIASSNATPGSNAIEFELRGDCTLTLTETLEINESVQIRNDSRSEFTLRSDASLNGSLMSVGGAGTDYEQIDLTLDGLIFDGNNVDNDYPLVEVSDTYYRAAVQIRNSSFMNAENSAIFMGLQRQLAVYDSSFYDNWGESGGAIHSYGTPVAVVNVIFDNNDAEEGGSIFHSGYEGIENGEQVVVVGSSFMNGNASNGGAISMLGLDQDPSYIFNPLSGHLVVQDSTFLNNQAGDSGGAIFATNSTVSLVGVAPIGDLYESETDYVPFSFGSTFSDNQATYGGAVAVSSGGLLTVGNYFYNNSANSGGAIFSHGDLDEGGEDALLISYADSFVQNDAQQYGSAIQAIDHFRVVIALDSILENYAGYGSAVSLIDNELNQVLVNNFANNTAGLYAPALRVQPAISRSEEAILYSDFNTIISHNTIINNTTGNPFGPEAVQVIAEYEMAEIGGNIFASDNPEYPQFLSTNPQVDFGANLITGPPVALGVAGLLPNFPAPLEGASAMVDWHELDLGEPSVNDSEPENDSWWRTIAIGENSIARDYYDLDSAGIRYEDFDGNPFVAGFWIDSRFLTRIDQEGNPIYGDGFDVGAYEIGWALNEVGTTPNISITGVSKPSISAGGDSFSVYGTGLDDVTELFVAGVKVSFRVVSSTELAVTTGGLPVGVAEILAIATDGRASFQLGVAVTDTPSFWTKNLGNGQVKLYAKNVVGAGKVRFMHNGKEIAWINAVDETDPKLRKAAAAAYLVRTVNLVSGKNRLEITLDGVRVRFTTYNQ